jgi:hypothetical protein
LEVKKDTTIQSPLTVLFTNPSGKIPRYSEVHGFWLVEELAELVDGPIGCGKVESGGHSFAWNFRVKRTSVLVEAEGRTKPNMTLSLH